MQGALRYGRWAFWGLILGYLTHRLAHIGWRDIVEQLPANPLFYIFFLARYLTLPVSELLVFQKIWDRSLAFFFSIFIRKRIYNYAILSYSGEAFLALWAQRTLNLPKHAAIIGVKDANILSAFTANITTLLLILGLASFGVLNVKLQSLPGGNFLFSAGIIMASSAIIVVSALRNRIISLSVGKVRGVLIVHFIRQGLLIAFFVGMYASALPDASLSAYMIFVALFFVITRIPFLPNQDLLYLSVALSLAPVFQLPEEAVAGMLIAEAGLAQMLNFFLFIATSRAANAK